MVATIAQRIELSKQRASNEAERAVVHLGRFASLAGQLALLLVVFCWFNVENEAFFRLATACFLGFAVHAFLPFYLK